MKHRMLTTCLVAFGTAVSAYAALGGPMRGALTPEEHMMYMQEQRGTGWRDLSLQQRCERQQQMHRQWASMTAAGLHSLKQQLDARWDALPSAEKQRLQQRLQRRVADRSARRVAGSAAPRQRPCAGNSSAPA